MWEEKNILCPGNEACSGTCSTLFSHDHVLCHCTLCQMRSEHYLYGNMTQQAKDIAPDSIGKVAKYIYINQEAV